MDGQRYFITAYPSWKITNTVGRTLRSQVAAGGSIIGNFSSLQYGRRQLRDQSCRQPSLPPIGQNIYSHLPEHFTVIAGSCHSDQTFPRPGRNSQNIWAGAIGIISQRVGKTRYPIQIFYLFPGAPLQPDPGGNRKMTQPLRIW